MTSEEGSGSVATHVMNRSWTSADLLPQDRLPNRTPPLPESGKTDPGQVTWPDVRALTCGFAWS